MEFVDGTESSRTEGYRKKVSGEGYRMERYMKEGYREEVYRMEGYRTEMHTTEGQRT
jgi:hypothetical protein